METLTDSIIFPQNETFTTEADASVKSINSSLVLVIQNTVGSIGIITNLTVIVVFS